MPQITAAPLKNRVWAVFCVFLHLGLTSFGGPVAHLGYFRDTFVTRRRWLSEAAYADLVALCQFLPGPASSQVGMAVGLLRAGFPGALAAWLGFTLPSAVVLMAFAAVQTSMLAVGVLHGLKLAAVAVVAQAVWGMARSLCTTPAQWAITSIAAGAVLFWPSVWGQVAVIAVAGLAGLVLFRGRQIVAHEAVHVPLTPRAGAVLLALFFMLLAGLPLLAWLWPERMVQAGAAFYQAGALVFGGGHVVLPLLQTAVVPPGWIDNDAFLAGYGAAQAVPGPLFTFAAFLGTVMTGNWWGGAFCLLAIFVPSFLLVAGALPFWDRLRRNARARGALAAVNAAVVGLLLAALYQPVWTGSVRTLLDVAIVVVALAALMPGRLPPWLVVTGCGVAGRLVGV